METKGAVELSDDLLEGAPAIARFIFGKDDQPACRKVYHLADGDRSGLPFFRMGNKLFARKSAIMQKIAEKEAAGQLFPEA
jgi:hypothetical protein